MKKETRKQGEGQDEMMSANNGQTMVKNEQTKTTSQTHVYRIYTGIMKRTKTKRLFTQQPNNDRCQKSKETLYHVNQ